MTTPLARPTASTGVKDRARSKPTMDAGPPDAVANASTTIIQTGDGVDRSEHDRPHRAIISTTTMTM